MHEMTEKFSLVPLTGTKETASGPVNVTHHMYQIMDEGVRVGYVGTIPGQPINFIRRYPEEYRAAVAKFVESHQGATPTRISEPPFVPPAEAEVEEQLVDELDSADDAGSDDADPSAEPPELPPDNVAE